MRTLRGCLFNHAGNLCKGETLEPKVAPSDGEMGDAYWGGAPCPIVINAGDARETTELNGVQSEADKAVDVWQGMLGLGTEG